MLGIEPVIEKLRTLENATLDRFVDKFCSECFDNFGKNCSIWLVMNKVMTRGGTQVYFSIWSRG